MLPVLYQDEYLIAIDKPAGMLVHRSAIDRLETEFVVQTLRDQIGQKVFPVHRLDKPTSGVMIFALDADTARLLTQAFTNKNVHKTYHAIVRGWVDDQRIDYPLKEVWDKMTDPQSAQNKDAQEAVTELSSLRHIELPHPVGRYATARYSLVELKPKTGRRHQLRRHLKHIFHPIVGDTTYGDGKHNGYFRQQWCVNDLLLSAVALQLTHPITGQALSLSLVNNKIIKVFERLACDASANIHTIGGD